MSGHFSFDTPPTVPNALQAVGFPPATILISKAVAISGAWDASIEAGTIPFYVQAPGETVMIQKVRFVRPAKSAIVVYAVSGLVVASCRIEGFVPLPNIQFSGIGISTSDMAATPTPSQPGHPENISGRILIANNDLDLTGGTLPTPCLVSPHSARDNRQTQKWTYIFPETGSGTSTDRGSTCGVLAGVLTWRGTRL